MCGIAGIIGQIDDTNRCALKRMSDSLTHRGPDGSGFWESSADLGGWGVMLAHRRLSILDLSNAASQPMIDPTTGDAIVVNGEIYNYRTLRNALAADGHAFQSSGDTAVMLRAISVQGPSAISTLRGMFAFAFWDVHARQLLIARDPLGIKPLYIIQNQYQGDTWKLAFASEVRSLLASNLTNNPRISPAATASIIWNGFVVAPNTIINNIESIMPGEMRAYDARGKEQSRKRYWTMATRAPLLRTSEADIARALEESVRLHLASDAPLGVFLSGGIDSSVVANLAQKANGTQIDTFTLAFEEPSLNEGDIAREVANSIGTRHHEIILSEQQFIGCLDSALDSLDQPSFDGLNSYYMSHAVREAGFKVALVGSGGDELFGGYRTFRDLPAFIRWSRGLRFFHKDLRESASDFVSSMLRLGATGKIPRQTRWAKLPEMLKHTEDLVALYQIAYALFLPAMQRTLLGDTVAESLQCGLPASIVSGLRHEARGRTALSAISVLEHRLFLGERLLRDTDSTSMSASIEVRLPLVDHALFENVDRLNDGGRYYPVGRKDLLRRIGLNGLNPKLFDRPKSGFVLPYDRWLRNDLGKTIDLTLRDPVLVKPTGLNAHAVSALWRAFLDGAPGLYWSRIWGIYVYIRWCHRHRVFT